MWVVPVGALGVVLGQLDLDVVGMARSHRAHDVVGDAARAGVRPVEVEVGVVELVRFADVGRQDVAVRRHVVDQGDLELLARLHAQGRAGAAAFIGAYVEPDPADLAVGIGAAQGGGEHAVDRAAHLGLGERLVHGRNDLVRLHTERRRHHGGMIVRRVGRIGAVRHQQIRANTQAAVQQTTPPEFLRHG